MKIVGFNIDKILVERKSVIKPNLEIKSNLNIDSIKEDSVPFSKLPAAKFNFSFMVNYEPDTAKIEILGNVLTLIDDGEDVKETIKNWKKKDFSPEVKASLFNFILGKCNLKSIQLEDEMNLPLHVPFPKVTPNSSETDKSKDNRPNYTR